MILPQAAKQTAVATALRATLETMAKEWSELLSDDDALPLILQWAKASLLEVEVLPAAPESARRALETLQLSTRSPLGAVAWHTGGVLVDHGWLRVLGSGCERLPRALDLWNTHAGAPRCDKGVLIADDVLGGFFAWFREPRTVHYLAPDTLAWEDSELGYSDWLSWTFTDRLQGFYEDLRWPRWSEEVAALAGDRGLSVYPPLFAKGAPIGERARGAVPVDELWALAVDYERRLGGLPDGAKFKLVVTP